MVYKGVYKVYIRRIWVYIGWMWFYMDVYKVDVGVNKL